MKRKLKRIFGVLAAAFMCLALPASVTACSPSEGEKIDPTKTQLYVGILDAGLGDEYMKDLKARFQEAYSGYKGEGDKVGVQVIIDKQKETFRGSTLINNIENNRQEVYFTEQIFYDQWLRRDKLVDITDVATGSLSEFGEDATIESKMFDADIDYLKRDGKYYGIPFYTSFMTISYDADLFDEKGLYFTDDGEFIGTKTGDDGMPVPDLSQKSLGQDGIEGTLDDGLPITYDQFFKLCDEMKSLNITPMHWAGDNGYLYLLLNSMYADYEGAEQYALNFSPTSGTIAHYIADRSDIGSTLDSVNTTTYELNANSEADRAIFRQAGRYYSVKFAETLVKNNYSGPLSFSPSESFLTAQETFLYSSRLANGSNKTPIGMFVDGTWWYNEASSIFADMADTYPDSAATDRRIGIMPYPKPTAEAAAKKENHLLMENETLVFINKAIDEKKLELAKAFIRFSTTDESMKRFTKITNLLRSYKYSLSEDEVKELPFFGQTYYEYAKSAEFIYPRANNLYYLENVKNNCVFNSGVADREYTNPSRSFKDNSSLTAEDYFFGLHAKV